MARHSPGVSERVKISLLPILGPSRFPRPRRTSALNAWVAHSREIGPLTGLDPVRSFVGGGSVP
jgi:hypothetical protein